MNDDLIRKILTDVSYPGMTMSFDDQMLQVEFTAECSKTGGVDTWKGRKWYISRHATKSEIVQTAFKAVLTALEHEAREKFRYRGLPVYGPHFNVDRLVTLALDPGAEDIRS